MATRTALLLHLLAGIGHSSAFSLSQPLPPSAHLRAAAARCCADARPDFSGQYSMDLKASDPLGPVLRELGLNKVVAALIARVGVEQTISQNAQKLLVEVKTAISTSSLRLTFDGEVTMAPGITGGETACTSRWLDASRLETRQSLSASDNLPPSDPAADVFITVRSLGEGGAVLVEDVAVVRGGQPVEGATAKRILRRV